MVLRGDTAFKKPARHKIMAKCKTKMMEWDEAENGNKLYFGNLAFEDFYFQFIQCLSWRIKSSIALNILALEKKRKYFMCCQRILNVGEIDNKLVTAGYKLVTAGMLS